MASRLLAALPRTARALTGSAHATHAAAATAARAAAASSRLSSVRFVSSSSESTPHKQSAPMSTAQQPQQAQQVTKQQQQLHIKEAPESKMQEEHKQSGQQLTAHKQEEGVIKVRDIFDKELMNVSKDDVSKQRIGWLRDRMLDQMESVRGISKHLGKDEELYVYSTFGSWYGDETPLKEVKGDLKYFRRGPHEGKYEMSVALPDQREVKVEVSDQSTVADVKKQVAQRTHPRIDPWHQILSFQRRALLDDFATLDALRLPRFGRFDLLW